MKRAILASVSMLAVAAGAAAQTAPINQGAPASNAPQGAAPASVSNNPPEGLQDIIVTAQRTAESAQKAPLAIAVIKPEELVRQNVTRSEELSRVVPALLATSSGGPNTSFFLRGVGNFSSNSYSDPAISFNYDGVYIGRPNSTQGFFYDLQRVEVLKGPQGTLYGRNATGGAINVIPNRPVVGETSVEAEASYGNYNAVQAQGAVNVPIGPDGAFRLSGAVNRHDGYLSDGTGDQKEVAVRAQVLADLTPNLTTRIGVDYSHEGGVGSGSYIYGTYAVNPATNTYAFTPTPQLGATIGLNDPRSEAFLQTRFVSQAGRFADTIGSYPYQRDSVWGATNETNLKTAAGTLTVQAAYRESTIHALTQSSYFRGFIINEHVDQTSLEARFAGKLGSAFDYLVGAFYFDESIKNTSAINQFTVLPIQTYATGTTSKAAFGRVALHATDTLTFTAAGRYTDDYKRFNGLSDVYTLNCGNPFAPPQDLCPTTPFFPLVTSGAQVIAYYTALGVAVGANGVPPPAVLNVPRILDTQIPINSSLTTRKFTYRAAADWQITPSNLLYASYETGFHGGGFNFGRGIETYQPETIQAFTIGSKNRFFDNRLQLNIEAFYWKYKGQQISQFGTDFSTPPISVFYTSNIGRSTIKGVDLDVEYLITRNTRVTGSVQYLDNKYDSYTVYGGTQAVPNFACPYSTVTYKGAPAFAIDCSGKPGLFSPKWSFNVGVQQTFELGGYKLVAAGGTRWRDDFFAASSFQPWTISKAAFQSDASLTFAPDSDRYFISGFINNIEDKRRITQSNLNNSFNIQTALATAPRTYGVRVGARF